MILSAGLLAARAWKMPSRSLELAKVESTVKSKSPPASGKTAGASGFRPAESVIRVFDAADMIGNGSISESGAQQFAYGTGTKVSLRAPFKFGVPSANSGALFYGKSTVYVTTGSPFSLTMPNTMLTCSGGEFGLEIDRSGEGWIQVFRGGATLWVPNSDVEARQKIVLGENESVRIRQGDGRCMATVIHDADLAASLAARMPPRLPPQDGGKEPSPAALAWKPNATALKGSAAALPVAAETGTFLLCAGFDGKKPSRRPRVDEPHSRRPLQFVGTAAARQPGGSSTGQVPAGSAVRRPPVCGLRDSPQRQRSTIARGAVRRRGGADRRGEDLRRLCRRRRDRRFRVRRAQHGTRAGLAPGLG